MISTCIFCKNTGHNIQSCNSSKIQSIVLHYENHISELNTSYSISQYLGRISVIHLRLLARHKDIRANIQKAFIIDQLAPHYYANNIRKRVNELNELFSEIVTPVFNINFMSEIDIRDTILEYFHSLEQNIERTTYRLTLFYNTLHYANVELHGRYNPFIDIIYNSRQQALEIMRRPELPDIVTRQWTITPFLRITQNKSNTNECPICFSSCNKKDIVYTNCNHSFCNNCFHLFLRNCPLDVIPSCPLCRKSITHIETITPSVYNEYETEYSV